MELFDLCLPYFVENSLSEDLKEILCGLLKETCDLKNDEETCRLALERNAISASLMVRFCQQPLLTSLFSDIPNFEEDIVMLISTLTDEMDCEDEFKDSLLSSLETLMMLQAS